MTTHPLTPTLEKPQVKIGGMQCSFCAGSIRKAYERMEGVAEVAVSLPHEEAMLQFYPVRVTSAETKEPPTSLGYTVRNPRKVRSLGEEEAEVRSHRILLMWAVGFMVVSLGFMNAMWVSIRQPWFVWAILGLSLGMVFDAGEHILEMASAALRRGILNQHVLLIKFEAFGGLAGGIIRFFTNPWPTSDFSGAATVILRACESSRKCYLERGRDISIVRI